MEFLQQNNAFIRIFRPVTDSLPTLTKCADLPKQKLLTPKTDDALVHQYLEQADSNTWAYSLTPYLTHTCVSTANAI